jgi:hypothetical protein
MSKPALWATSTDPAANSRNAGRADSMRGAPATMESVMPVSTEMKAGMAAPGLTSVWNSPTTSPPRTLTAPISVMPHSIGLPPVVSRSTTTKVTDDSGVPRSSNVPWTIVMPPTVGSRTDTSAKARWHGRSRAAATDAGARAGGVSRHPVWSAQRRRR